METLLSNYSITDIVVLGVLIFEAIKKLIDYLDWGNKKLNKYSKKRLEKEQWIAAVKQGQKDIDNIKQQMELLLQSDRDQLKAYLTQAHHHFYHEAHWIDGFHLECCEKCFADYEAEGGNSFIARFMDDLRSLPNYPPEMNNDLTEEEK